MELFKLKSRIARWVGASVLAGVCTSTFMLSKNFEPGSQNPVLRRFFWEQAIQASTTYDAKGRRYFIGSRALLPGRVDGLVDNFLVKTRDQLIQLRRVFDQVKVIRIRILDSPPGSVQRRESLLRWKQPLGELADKANEIRKSLSYPFVGLDRKEKFRYKIPAGAENQAFEREVGFLEDEVAKAEQQIRDYLFTPTHTITVEALRGENMLINLYRVQKLSELLEKKL